MQIIPPSRRYLCRAGRNRKWN